MYILNQDGPSQTVKLNQILYLKEAAFVGTRSWHPHELVDCGCPKRAKTLEDKGLGFVVGRAYEHSAELQRMIANGEDDHWLVLFLNRCKLLPIEYQTPEVLAFAKNLIVPESVKDDQELANEVYETVSTTLNFQVIPNERAEIEPANSPEWVYEKKPLMEKPEPKPKRTRKKKAQAD